MPTRTFRLFVSSTFSDWQLEREALRTRVFPKLEALCRSYGGRFHPIDLRWGISEAAADDQQTLQICFREIERCRQASAHANFIALVGDRYGWRPLPDHIPAGEFEQMRPRIAADARELLEARYRRDDNAVEPHFRLLPRTSGGDASIWQNVERRLGRALRQAAIDAAFDVLSSRKYLASVTEREIAHRGLLDEVPDAAGAFVCCRRITPLPDEGITRYTDADEHGRRDVDARDRLEALKRQLRDRLPGRVLEYESAWGKSEMAASHLDRFCDEMHARLANAILPALTERVAGDPLDEEIASHEAFGSERRKYFVGRERALAAIERHLAEQPIVPLIVAGPSGSGKTTLMAQAIADARGRYPDARVFCRFVGATPGSSDVATLLSTLWREIGIRSSSETMVPETYPDLVGGFWDRCRSAAEQSRLILFVDSLDQLLPRHDAPTLSWLPTDLPPHVQLVVSTIPNETLTIAEQFVPRASRCDLEPMPRQDAGALLDRWLQDARRTLQADQRAAVLDAFDDNGLPLYLRLAFEDACRWPSDSRIEPLPRDVPGIIRALCSRLSAAAGHGAVLVSRSLAYVAAGKLGLTHEEILDVLSRDEHVMQDVRQRSLQPLPAGDPLPLVMWSRLYFDLAPYLVERTAGGVATLDFFHRQFREVIEHDYLGGTRRPATHAALARYFGGQQYEPRVAGAAAPNVRKLGEWPHQLAGAELWRELERLLLHYDFLQRKVTEMGVAPLIDDFDLVGASPPPHALENIGRLHTVREALRLSSGAVTTDPTHLAGQLLARLLGDSGVAALLSDAARAPDVPWLQPRIASLTAPGGPLRRSLALTSPVGALAITMDGVNALLGCADGVVRIAGMADGREQARFRIHSSAITALATIDRQRAATGHDDGTIAVWNIHTGVERLRLTGHSKKISALSSVGTDRLLSGSWDGTLRLWNLSDGAADRVFECGNSVGPVAVTPDGRHVLFGSQNLLRLWRLADGHELQQVRVNDGGVYSIALTPDGRRAVVGTGDLSTACFTLRIWSLDPWQERHRIEGRRWVGSAEGHTNSIGTVAVTARGDTAVSGSDDHTLRVWDIETGRLTAVLKGHAGAVRHVTVSPDSRTALSSSSAVVCCWSLDPAAAAAPRPHRGAVRRLIASAAAQRVCSSDRYGGTCLWMLRHSNQIESDAREMPGLVPLAITPDFTVAAASAHDYFARSERAIVTLWDMDRHEPIGKASMDAFVTSAAFIRGASQMVIGLESGALVVVDRASLQPVTRLTGHIEGVDHIACLDDGRVLVTGSRDGSVRLWDLAAARQIGQLDNVTGVPALALTPDGKHAATGSHFGRIHVWDLERQCLVREIIHGEGTQNFSVLAVALSPDGSRLLSGGTDHNIRLWNSATGTPIATFVAEDWTMCAAAVGPDLFAAGSQDGAVHILSVREGASPARLR